MNNKISSLFVLLFRSGIFNSEIDEMLKNAEERIRSSSNKIDDFLLLPLIKMIREELEKETNLKKIAAAANVDNSNSDWRINK